MDFEQYVRERRPALFRFGVVLCGDPVLADDIVTDVAFEKWAMVSAAEHVHAYVRRMVVNEFLSWRRRRVRTSVVSSLESLMEPVGDGAAQYDERLRLVDELRGLPAKQRAAIVLRYYEGLSFAEIATVLGTGENAVRSNVLRGLSKLRVQLTESFLTEVTS